MKKVLLIGLIATVGTFSAKSQTKGTNAVGIGLTTEKFTRESDKYGYKDKGENNLYSLTYGRFIKDNVRIGLTGNYSEYSTNYSTYSSKSKNYGGSINYQKYYPLLKKFYAIAGGRGSYFYQENKGAYSNDVPTSSKYNTYSVGAYGGAAYFLTKHIAFETELLSANFSYGKNIDNSAEQKTETKRLNLSTTGFINNLGFNIYFLF